MAQEKQISIPLNNHLHPIYTPSILHIHPIYTHIHPYTPHIYFIYTPYTPIYTHIHPYTPIYTPKHLLCMTSYVKDNNEPLASLKSVQSPPRQVNTLLTSWLCDCSQVVVLKSTSKRHKLHHTLRLGCRGFFHVFPFY